MSHSAAALENTPDTALRVADLTVAYQNKPVLLDVDLAVPSGVVAGIVGPNGAGKSTLIKAVLDLVPHASGLVEVFGKPYRKQRSLVGYVPQRESVDWDYPISAVELVEMGLYRKIGWFKPVTRVYRNQALDALDRVGMADFAERQISRLSGGQQQRIFVVHHDLETVREYFDYLIMLNMRVVAAGHAADVFTTENLHRTYGGRLTLLDRAVNAIGGIQ